MKTKLIKLSIILFLIIILASIVSAIGVSPSNKIIEFEPNLKSEVTFSIINSENKDLKAVVYARGDYAKYTTLKETLVNLKSADKSRDFTFQLNLPKEEKPGIHEAEIVVMEFPEEFATESETVITATTAVIAKLKIRVPYPGKYAEAKLYAYGNEPNKKVKFVMPVFNYGTLDIEKAKATIQILGATYEEIAAIESNEAKISSKDEAKLEAEWLANVNPGKYHVIATIWYDNEKITIEDDINIGSLFIDITRIDVKDFNLGEVAKFDIFLQSKWNELIENVYGEMTVTDKGGTEYTKFRTAATSMPALGQAKIEAYWDTAGIKVGTYDMHLVIYYAGATTERVIETQVNIDSIRTSLTPTAQLVAPTSGKRDTLLMLLVFILIIINIAWFIYFKRSRKKK